MTDLTLTRTQYLELEKLALGAFQPVAGFMDEDRFTSVVSDMRLPGGEPFPLPVTLDVTSADAARVKGRPSVALVFEGAEVGTIVPESIFTCDKPDVARQVFGTADPGHPGVRFFMQGGDHFVGGPVELKQRVAFDYANAELTPAETRRLFAQRGWTTIVGFQTRNVPHRAHEHLQRLALEYADGLFIQPLIGRRKVGDYTPEAILAGYRTLIGRFYPQDRVVLGILTTAMRYAGPREAVFHAIIRRNYGCTHFVVGRDHAGVDNHYAEYAAHELTRRFDGELGIEILRFHGPHYCALCDGIVTGRSCPHEATAPDAVTKISGSDMRAILTGGSEPAPHLMRPEVVEALAGIAIFIEADDP